MGLLTRIKETKGAPVNDPQEVERLRKQRGGTEVSPRTQDEINQALGAVASENGVVSPELSRAVHHGEITVTGDSETTPVEVSHPDAEA